MTWISCPFLVADAGKVNRYINDGNAPLPGFPGGFAAVDGERLSASKRALLRLLVEVGALQFGEFTLKSGRVSPYFFNSARFRTGGQLARLGEAYADVIESAAPEARVIFGPAYKGVPLCVAAAMALSRRTGCEVGYLFNRKEAKAHGDKGLFVGEQPEPGDRVVLVDDVITDGGTKLEAVALLREAFAAPIDALVIAFNRMEQDPRGGDAVRRFTEATGIPVVALLTLAELEAALAESLAGGGAPDDGDGPLLRPDDLPAGVLDRIRDYRRRYGTAG